MNIRNEILTVGSSRLLLKKYIKKNAINMVCKETVTLLFNHYCKALST